MLASSKICAGHVTVLTSIVEKAGVTEESGDVKEGHTRQLLGRPEKGNIHVLPGSPLGSTGCAFATEKGKIRYLSRERKSHKFVEGKNRRGVRRNYGKLSFPSRPG